MNRHLLKLIPAISFCLCFTAPAQQPAGTAQPASAQERFFSDAKIDALDPSVGRTRTIGAPTGIEYADVKPEGGIIIGFDIWKGNYQKLLVVFGIQPIYLTPHGKVRGKRRGGQAGQATTVEAHEGFAVGGIEAKGGDRVDQLRVIFMRINPVSFNLDPGTSYKSDWIGGKGGGRDHQLLPGGKPVIGIYGGSGSELDRFGLLYLDRK
jgi:hypothetical protein